MEPAVSANDPRQCRARQLRRIAGHCRDWVQRVAFRQTTDLKVQNVFRELILFIAREEFLNESGLSQTPAF